MFKILPYLLIAGIALLGGAGCQFADQSASRRVSSALSASGFGSEASSGPSENEGPQISILAENLDSVGWGLAVDSRGNVYTTTSGGVMKISHDGVKSRVLDGAHGGYRILGYPDGLAPFTLLAVDRNDNLYAVSWYGGDVLKVSSQGGVSVFGTMESGALGMTVDGDGGIYYTIYPGGGNLPHGAVVKRLTSLGMVSVFAAGLDDPQGLASDSVGNIYVIDAGNAAVKKITPGGLISRVAGTGVSGTQDGAVSQATFSFRGFGHQPTGIAISTSGDLYIGESYGVGLLRKIGADGNVSVFCGDGQDDSGVLEGSCSRSPLYLNSVAISSDGYLYFNDGYNRIAKVFLR